MKKYPALWPFFLILVILALACGNMPPFSPEVERLLGGQSPTPTLVPPTLPAQPTLQPPTLQPPTELPSPEASPAPVDETSTPTATVVEPTTAPEAEALGDAAAQETAAPAGVQFNYYFPLIAAPPSVFVDPQLPAALKAAVSLAAVDQPERARLRLEAGDQAPVTRWLYALVAPFPSLPQGVSSEELRRAWRGEAAGPFAGRPLLMDESTQAVLSVFWGPPAAGAISVLPAGDLLNQAWNQRPSWAIVPFEDLEPRWKVLEVDGLSPLRNDFDLESYALSLSFSLSGDPALAAQLSPMIPATNRDPGRLTVLAMTGVTALVRATAHTMERQGILYPGQDVGAWLRSADLAHISNEVPFASNCPFPNPVQADVRFCSDPRYIALLEDVGADVIELTGDHFQDWGTEAMLYTLELYRERGWPYYGGGANLEEGRQAVLIEHNGNRLAFIGCNGKGGSFAQAGANTPGAVACGYDFMEQEIARLRGEGYLPIATFQHFEYYTYQAQPNQVRDFRRMAEAGAVVVSGSQAHQPQALEFAGDGLIHYGLGNMFFDQYIVSQATRQAFIDRHVFYAGRYIGAELLPMMFVDFARPRPMTPAERDDLLNAVFSASGW